jgi:hypothetical protein
VLNLVPVGGKLLVTNCYDHFPLVSADRRLIMVSALKVWMVVECWCFLAVPTALCSLVDRINSIAQYPLSNVSIFLASGFELSVSISYPGEFWLLIVEAMQLSAKGLHVVIQAWHIDLSQHLLEDVYVGFAGSTGEFIELNQIKSWNFITIDDDDNGGRYVTKATWFLFISLLCACVVVAIWSQQRRLYKIEMMKDVPSVWQVSCFLRVSMY